MPLANGATHVDPEDPPTWTLRSPPPASSTGVWQDRGAHATAGPSPHTEEELQEENCPGMGPRLRQGQRPVRRKSGRPAACFREEDRAARGETPAVTPSASDADQSSRGKHSGAKAHLYTQRPRSVKATLNGRHFPDRDRGL